MRNSSRKAIQCFTFKNNEFDSTIPYSLNERDEWNIEGVEVIENDRNCNYAQIDLGRTPRLNWCIPHCCAHNDWILFSMNQLTKVPYADCLLHLEQNLTVVYSDAKKLKHNLWLIRAGDIYTFNIFGQPYKAKWTNEGNWEITELY